MICEHCGWLIPVDCTCRLGTDRIAAALLAQAVADRHQQAVARARASGWAPDRRPTRIRREAA